MGEMQVLLTMLFEFHAGHFMKTMLGMIGPVPKVDTLFWHGTSFYAMGLQSIIFSM